MVLHDNLECADNTLPALFPAPELPRQFVDDLATMVVANTEDVVVTTICSAGRWKTGTHVEQNQIHDRQQSQCACRKKTKSTQGLWPPATSGRCRARSGYSRCWRKQEAAKNSKPGFRAAKRWRQVSLSASAEKPQGSRSLHDCNVAVSCLFGGTIGLVANRPQAVRKHGRCLCWSGRSSSLPDHCH